MKPKLRYKNASLEVTAKVGDRHKEIPDQIIWANHVPRPAPPQVFVLVFIKRIEWRKTLKWRYYNGAPQRDGYKWAPFIGKKDVSASVKTLTKAGCIVFDKNYNMGHHIAPKRPRRTERGDQMLAHLAVTLGE